MNAQNEELNQFLSNVSNFGHSGKRPKTLNLLYLIEFLIDLYEIFRDDSFWVTKSVYHKKNRKIYFAHAQCSLLAHAQFKKC